MTTTICDKGLLPIIPLRVKDRILNVILDKCSTMSYILNDVEAPLKARRIGTTTTTINTVGASTTSKGPLAEFSLSTTDGEEITVKARVINRIIPDINTKEYREATEKCKEEYPDLELPTFENHHMKIHGLLDLKTAARITGKEVWKIGKELEIRDTCITSKDV